MAELVDSDEWADLAAIIAVIDAEVAAVLAAVVDAFADDDARHEPPPGLAARLQDALLACVAVRDLPPQRPSSLRRVSVAGAARCSDSACALPGCLGNRLDGRTLVLPHTKTARSRGTVRLEVPPDSSTDTLLTHHLTWGRAALLKGGDSDALFVSPHGAAYSEAGFNARLTTCLRKWGLSARITHCKVRLREGGVRGRGTGLSLRARSPWLYVALTRARPPARPAQLRHIVATATCEWSAEQREGAAKRCVCVTNARAQNIVLQPGGTI